MWILLFLALLLPPRADDKPLNYFLENRTERCWVLDRASNKDVISVAANGFGMASWAVAAEKGLITKEQAVSWVNTCLDRTVEANKGNYGWLYHWTDNEGVPVFNREVSSIDTALFYLGARQADARLGDRDLIDKVEGLIAHVDRRFMLTNNGQDTAKKFFSHGFIWKDGKPEFLKTNWEDYSEGVLIYRLFGVPYEPPSVSLDLPLFVYYYPLCFYREKGMVSLLGRAMDRQVERFGVCGFTACDGPKGYSIMEENVVSPIAVASCEPFFPEKSRAVLDKLAVDPITPAIHLKTKWVSTDRIGIDDGAYVLTHYPHQ